jgi:hypothetical protein
MANILTTSSNIICTHGGLARLSSSNKNIFVNGNAVLLESDIHIIQPGTCPFFVGSKYSPCVRIEWSQGSRRLYKNEIPLLYTGSLGKCFNGEGAIQGTANILFSQMKVLCNG